MKKSLAVISAIILIAAVLLTSCGRKNVYTDQSGEKHYAVTDKDGNKKVDEYGNFYEIITDKEGKTTKTQLYTPPEISTNKSLSKVENPALKINVPAKWKVTSATNDIVLHHFGECSKVGDAKCEITFRHDAMLGIDDLYEKSISTARWLVEYTGECSNLKEYNTKVLELPAKAYSYFFKETDMTCYNYFFDIGIYTIHIEAFGYKDCYTEEQLLELIGKSCTVKKLGESKYTKTSASTTTSATEVTGK